MLDNPTSLRTARERTIDALCERFADDTLSMNELERRLTRARQARTRDQLDDLLRDLPRAQPVTADASRNKSIESPTRPRANDPGGSDNKSVRTAGSAQLAIMGGTRRAGPWRPPENLVAVALMGGVELDFREAILSPGAVIDITCFTFWGGVEITVPPDLHVDTHGFAVMGAFEQSGEVKVDPPDDAPVIRVKGLALMGAVEIHVRPRGEAARGSPERWWDPERKRMDEKRREQRRLEESERVDSNKR